MREINVLFGFKNKKTEDAITKELQALGCHVNGEMRYRKHMIAEYVEEHPDVDAVILKEYLDGGERYGTQELVSLMDHTNTNIVVVLRSGHRGHDMMRELYHAGILNAYFTSGSRGAKPEKLAELVLHPRTRKEARSYYRIDEKPLHREVLAHEEFRDCYTYLVNEEEGINIIDRFAMISKWLTPQQMGIFVTTLPDDVSDVLKQYEEYYKIHQQLYRRRYVREPLRIPKNTQKGLSSNVLAEALVKESEVMEVDDTPVITPVEIKLVNHLPLPPEADEKEIERLKTQELNPGRRYEGKKMEAVDEDIYEIAERKQGREVKALFNFIEKFNQKPQFRFPKIRKEKERTPATDDVTDAEELIEEAQEADTSLAFVSEEEAEETISEKSADELIAMYGKE